MELKQIESLLLQEMEEVKGGVSGVCSCTSGAGEGTVIGGKCECTKLALQMMELKPEPPVCSCTQGELQ